MRLSAGQYRILPGAVGGLGSFALRASGQFVGNTVEFDTLPLSISDGWESSEGSVEMSSNPADDCGGPFYCEAFWVDVEHSNPGSATTFQC